MRIPETLRRRLAARAARIMGTRRPDVVIGPGADPYLLRWHLIPRNRLCNVYLHRFCRSDDDRALHDHPWASVSVILVNGYYEAVPADLRRPAGTKRLVDRPEGSVSARRARSAHRILLRAPAATRVGRLAQELTLSPRGRVPEATTLFLTGPKVRDWGFWCPKGWIPWQRFVDPGNSGQIGPGCEG